MALASKTLFSVCNPAGEHLHKSPHDRFEMAFSEFKTATLKHRNLVFYLAIRRPGDETWTILLTSKDIM